MVRLPAGIAQQQSSARTLRTVGRKRLEVFQAFVWRRLHAGSVIARAPAGREPRMHVPIGIAALFVILLIVLALR